MKQLMFLFFLIASFSAHAEQFSATVSWAQIVTLSTPLNGLVAHVNVEVGDKVKKGQLLASLDARPLQAELKRAEAVLQGRSSAYEEEKRELERAEELFDRTVLSQTELQNAQLKHSIAEAEFRRAEAELEQAKINLQYSKIHAPFSGVVVERNVQPGEVVANQLQVTPMLRIVRSTKLLASAKIPIEQASKLNFGDKIALSFNGHSIQGKVQQIISREGSDDFILKVIFEVPEKSASWGIATLEIANY